MPRSTRRLVRARTAASETPSAEAIWVNGRRPSSWRCSMMRLSSAESSSGRRFLRPSSSGFESRKEPSGLNLAGSTGAGRRRSDLPRPFCAVAPSALVELREHGSEALDGLRGDRIDDELDLRDAQLRVRAEPPRDLDRRALDRLDLGLRGIAHDP